MRFINRQLETLICDSRYENSIFSCSLKEPCFVLSTVVYRTLFFHVRGAAHLFNLSCWGPSALLSMYGDQLCTFPIEIRKSRNRRKRADTLQLIFRFKRNTKRQVMTSNRFRYLIEMISRAPILDNCGGRS